MGMIRIRLAIASAVAGLALLVVGAALIYVPAAPIVAGLTLLGLGIEELRGNP
jgi:hypothetical protein